MSAAEPLLSEADYLAFELGSDDRHELADGVVRAMTGASIRHNTVAMNLAFALRSAARGTGCRVSMEGVRLRVSHRRHYYPDVMATCEPDDDAYSFSAPCLVAEVLSPSTSAIDRGEKRLVYLDMTSTRHVLLIDADADDPVIEHYQRRFAADAWTLVLHRRGDTITLECPTTITVGVDDLLDVS